jgi:hypothetical protein
MRFIVHSCNRCTGGGDTLEFEEAILEEDQEQPREPEDPAGEGVPVDNLPECPDHRPSSFLIKLEYFYLFTALSYRSCVKTLVALYLSLSRYRT